MSAPAGWMWFPCGLCGEPQGLMASLPLKAIPMCGACRCDGGVIAAAVRDVERDMAHLRKTLDSAEACAKSIRERMAKADFRPAWGAND